MAQVDEHAKQRQQYFDDASKAHSAGDGKRAKELSTLGKEQTAKMEEALITAGYLIYKGKYVEFHFHIFAHVSKECQ